MNWQRDNEWSKLDVSLFPSAYYKVRVDEGKWGAHFHISNCKEFIALRPTRPEAEQACIRHLKSVRDAAIEDYEAITETNQ